MQKPLLIIAIILIFGCSGNLDKEIHIVLPNDFTGIFTLTRDGNGSRYTETDDYYTFTLNIDGNLNTPDLSLFNKWH